MEEKKPFSWADNTVKLMTIIGHRVKESGIKIFSIKRTQGV